jgi:antirestriction protein ArdC
MATITISAGGVTKTLDIPGPMVADSAQYVKTWMSLEGDTPTEIFEAWATHVINEVKDVLVNEYGEVAYNDSMTGSTDDAEAARTAAEASADADLVIG